MNKKEFEERTNEFFNKTLPEAVSKFILQQCYNASKTEKKLNRKNFSHKALFNKEDRATVKWTNGSNKSI